MNHWFAGFASWLTSPVWGRLLFSLDDKFVLFPHLSDHFFVLTLKQAMMTTTEEVAPTVVAAVEEVAAATIAPTKASQLTCCTLCIY
jgi:hypothetical protein